MRYFWSTVAAGLLSVAAINLHVDPTHRHARRVVPPAAGWSGDERFLPPVNFEERGFRAAQIRLTPRPGVVLLGSSRVIHVDGAALDSGAGLLNLGMSNATVEDYLALWQAMKDADKVPARLVIFADPWLFNERHDVKLWRANLPDVEAFLNASGRDRLWLLGQKALRRLDAGTDLLSATVLRTSLRALLSREAARADGVVVKAADAPSGRSHIRPDGSWSYLVEPPPTRDLAQVRKDAALAMLWGGHSFTGAQYVRSERALRFWDALAADVAARKTPLLVVVPPYQHSIWARYARPEYAGMIGEFSRELDASAARRGFNVCAAADPARVGCREDEFEDDIHATKPCLDKLMKSCLARAPGWKELARP
jgi:hypothetical protein